MTSGLAAIRLNQGRYVDRAMTLVDRTCARDSSSDSLRVSQFLAITKFLNLNLTPCTTLPQRKSHPVDFQ